MTDPVIRAFREAARHGISSIGEDRLKAMLSKWLDTDGPAAFRAAADSGTIVREDGTDNSGSPLWRLKGGSAAALLHLRARVLEAQIRVRALPAAKFRPRPGEKPDKDGYFWRSTDTGKKYRIREGDDVRKTVRRALPDGGSGGGPGGKKPGGKRPRGSGDDGGGMRHYHAGVRKLRNAIRRGLTGGSYIPKIGRIMDLLDRHQAREFHSRYTVDGTPVYICAVTDNKNADFGRVTEDAYGKLDKSGHDACVGTWTDPKNKDVYNDTSMIFSGTRWEE